MSVYFSVVLQFLPVCFCSYTSLVFLTDLRGSLKGDTFSLVFEDKMSSKSKNMGQRNILLYKSFQKKGNPL